MSQIDATLARLLALHPNKLIDLKLHRIERLLDALGRPQDRLPAVIHVAGTNGKGSTIAHLRAFLEAAGQRVHTYTSPHLVAFRERIRLAGTLVTNKRLNKILEHCEAVNAGQPITYFEITTAAALYLFAKEPADYLLLEVGLGGRFDATNVVAKPLGTIITPVSIDHVEFLGDSLAEIAREKAGILKHGAPAVVARQPDAAREAIADEAKKLEVEPLFMGEDFDAYSQNGGLTYQDNDGLLDLPPTRLSGPFQIDNAGLAIAAIRHFGLPVTPEQIAKGLAQVNWPARLMPIKHGALRDLLPAGHELWLDGGHNEAGGQVLADALSKMHQSRPRPLILVMGTFANKDAKGFLSHFGNRPEQILTLRIPGERASWSARDLATEAKTLGLDAHPMRSVASALKLAAKTKDARVVICGSLHLAGHVLAQNKTPPS